MWEQATGEVKATYSSAYLDHTYRARAKKMETISPVSSDPVLDAIEDALVSSTPSNRYLIGGTSGFVDIIKVRMLYIDRKKKHMYNFSGNI